MNPAQAPNFPLFMASIVAVALLVSAGALVVFTPAIRVVLSRLVPEEASKAWLRYLQFAVLVVGLASGAGYFSLSTYLSPIYTDPNNPPLLPQITPERWALEVYRAALDALVGIAWALLAFFLIALIAYVIVRLVENRRSSVA